MNYRPEFSNISFIVNDPLQIISALRQTLICVSFLLILSLFYLQEPGRSTQGHGLCETQFIHGSMMADATSNMGSSLLGSQQVIWNTEVFILFDKMSFWTFTKNWIWYFAFKVNILKMRRVAG